MTSITYRPNVYGESISQLYAADLAYLFASLMKEVRKRKFELIYPEGFPKIPPRQFDKESVDLRKLQGNDGLSLCQIIQLINANKANLSDLLCKSESWKRVCELESTKDGYQKFEEEEEEDFSAKHIFLEVFRSIQADVSCVYGIFKDTKKRKITVSFRGTVEGGRDWPTNLNAWHTEMDTPKIVREKMRRSAKDKVCVHQGLYKYMFDNKKLLEGRPQRYDLIQEEIHKLIADGNPCGYTVYIAGHSLGAALATLVAFKLAGSTKPWIPKPITCITIASLRVGTSGFRDAFTQLEEDGLLRCLRIQNTRDTVPTISPVSFGALWTWKFLPKLYKHTGINVRFAAGSKSIVHPSRLGVWSSFTNALKNSMAKPFWNAKKYHARGMSIDRLVMQRECLSKEYIDEMYNDPKIVGPEFAKRYKEACKLLVDVQPIGDKKK